MSEAGLDEQNMDQCASTEARLISTLLKGQQTFQEAFLLRLLGKSEPLKCKLISELNMHGGTFAQLSFHWLSGERPDYF